MRKQHTEGEEKTQLTAFVVSKNRCSCCCRHNHNKYNSKLQ